MWEMSEKSLKHERTGRTVGKLKRARPTERTHRAHWPPVGHEGSDYLDVVRDA